MTIYLDYNATAPMRPDAKERMFELLGAPMNASSVHAWGRRARGIVEESRKSIAQAINCFSDEVIFCSSGTEANNWALKAVASGEWRVASEIEHASVLKMAGEERIPVSADGVVDVEKVASGEWRVASVMLANNETGVIQPVEEVVKVAKAKGALVHCDAVQGLGKIPVDFSKLGVDMMTISAHKMGGPVGAAALVVRRGLNIEPMLRGGGQESNRRAGTENVAAIAGFAKSVELMDFAQMERARGWLEGMEEEIVVSGGWRVTSAKRLPNTSCIVMPGVGSETQLIAFDLEGIAVSAGSACTSGKIEPSHVLKAMGIAPDIAGCAIRVSGGWNTQENDVKAFAKAWKTLYERALAKQGQKLTSKVN